MYLYIHAGAMNPYQSTLSTVGRILDNYDSDKMYPVYGFGAKVQYYEYMYFMLLLKIVHT